MGYALALASSTRYETLGISANPAQGTDVAGGVGAYGSLVTIGTTSFDYDGLILQVVASNGPGTPRYRITITVNTGVSDQPLIQDYFIDLVSNFYTGQNVQFPVRVPKGAVLKAQTWTTGSANGLYIAITGFQGDAKQTRGFRGALSTTDFGVATPAAPTLGSVAGGTLAATTYFAKLTYVSAAGLETLASAETSLAVALDFLLVVTSPAASPGAVTYNVYVSTATGTETKQNAAPIAIGTNWTEPSTGLIAGAAQPAHNFTGQDPTNALTFTGSTVTGWVQAQASTPTRFAGLMVMFDALGNSNSGIWTRFDIGWGASGSERVLFPIFTIFNGTTFKGVEFFLQCDLPAGTRLVYRGQCYGGNTNTCALVLLGLAA